MSGFILFRTEFRKRSQGGDLIEESFPLLNDILHGR